jgi:hypothetical protein
MLEYHRHSTYAAPDPGAARRWRSALKPDDVRLIEARVGPLLQSRGYEPSGLSPLAVTPALARRLRRQDRLARLRFRLKRYGPALVVAGALARRLGPQHIRDRIDLVFQRIDERHLA